jgi:hypothetical protein
MENQEGEHDGEHEEEEGKKKRTTLEAAEHNLIDNAKKRERNARDAVKIQQAYEKEKDRLIRAVLHEKSAEIRDTIKSQKSHYDTVLALFSGKGAVLDSVASKKNLQEAFQRLQEHLITHYHDTKGARLPDTYYSSQLSARDLCVTAEESFELARFHVKGPKVNGNYTVVLRCVLGFGPETARDHLVDNVNLSYEEFADTFPNSSSHNRDAAGTFPLWEYDQERVTSSRRKDFVNSVGLLCDEQGRPLENLQGLYACLGKQLPNGDTRNLFKYFVCLAREFVVNTIATAQQNLPLEHCFVEPSFVDACWQSATIFDYWTEYHKRPRCVE